MISLSYLILEEYRKKNYGYEALIFYIDYVFKTNLTYLSKGKRKMTLQPEMIYAVIEPDNIPSEMSTLIETLM